MDTASIPLGEDEFGALLERTSMARNHRLVRAAARQIVDFDAYGSRMDFARELMKQLTYLAGPLHLDLLSDDELSRLVEDAAESVIGRSKPRRAI